MAFGPAMDRCVSPMQDTTNLASWCEIARYGFERVQANSAKLSISGRERAGDTDRCRLSTHGHLHAESMAIEYNRSG